MFDYNMMMRYFASPFAWMWLWILLWIWSLIWKAFALWKSARNNSVVWFIVFILVNTLGILEILYIYIFAKYDKKLKK
ncbi:MAG: DUF5652 family protein [Patescibacteria group bacterium]|nr:DUF5652 family protein [Patescibacteria group bacterium]